MSQPTDTNKIKCSVGILTLNSEKTLRRALESVKDFADIIISDGGSSDNTLRIAREYGATTINQHAKMKPSPDPAHPIADFASERNLMLQQATEDWFFWLDSDEYISKELHDEVAAVCSQSTPNFFAYKVPIVRQSPDAKITYREWKQAYQIRFFNLRTGGSFHRKIHERFIFDTKKYETGTLAGAWYVPLSKTDFDEYKKAVEYRLTVMLSEVTFVSIWMYLYKALYQPLKRTAGILYREIRLRLRYAPDELMPIGYMRNRLYSQWVTFKIVTKLYFSKKS